MPREIVSHDAPLRHSTVSIEAWVKEYFIPSNYSSSRVAFYESTGERSKEDYTYRVKSLEDDFGDARIACWTGIVLLGVPLRVTAQSTWLKQHDDEMFCSQRSHKSSEPSWCHCVHADYSRAGDFIFTAIKPDENFQIQLGVAISLLEIMRFYVENVPQCKDLSMRIFNMPQVSDSMQKYIACIVLDKEYSPEELKIMVQTTIVRNRKWNADDLSSTAALLILLPMVKQLFRETEPGSRLTAVPRLHEEFKAKLASFDLRAKYHVKTADLPTDGWTTVRKGKAGARTINPEWIKTVSRLSIHFGVGQALVDTFQKNLQEDNMSAPGKLVVRFKLPTEEVFWIRNTAVDMRLVKVDQGVRAVGLSVHSKCYLTLSPDTRAGLKAYRLTLSPQCEGGGTFTVSSENDKRSQRTMLTTCPVSVEMDLRNSTCILRQKNIESTLKCNRLLIHFSGGILTLTPTLSSKTRKKVDATADLEACGICLEDTKPSDVKHITECNHTFHKPCIDEWIAHCGGTMPFPTCPMCRRRM